MQTSGFQLGLIATLALGLGFSLAASQAIGYPAGAAVSMGANPVWSVGGQVDSASTVEILTAPADQDVVVTDIYITSTCMNCSPRITLDRGDTRLASYRYWQWTDGGSIADSIVSPESIKHALVSGLRVPAGETLTLSLSASSIDYTIAGYYAQP